MQCKPSDVIVSEKKKLKLIKLKSEGLL